MKRPLVILGGPGDGIVAAEIAAAASAAGAPYELVGFLNDALTRGTIVSGVPVLGPFEAWSELSGDVLFLPAVHKVGAMRMRVSRMAKLAIPPERWATVSHPQSCLARDVRLGRGVLVGSFVTVQPGCVVGDFATIRAGANLGHDAVVGEFGYVGPNATLCGRARVGYAAHVGPNAVVMDRIAVGDYAIAGIGAAVTKNVAVGAVVLGNPARVISPMLKNN